MWPVSVRGSDRYLIRIVCQPSHGRWLLAKADGSWVEIELEFFTLSRGGNFGGIAQLVERLVRNEKVRGSNPLTSKAAGVEVKIQIAGASLLDALARA